MSGGGQATKVGYRRQARKELRAKKGWEGADVLGEVLDAFKVATIYMRPAYLANMSPMGTAQEVAEAIEGVFSVFTTGELGEGGRGLLDLIHPAIAEYMEAEAEGGRGRSVLEGLSELPAPARLGRRLAGKGTSTTFPGSRQEAIGQFVVDSAYLRKASMEAISEKAYRRGSPEERLQHRINSLREDSLEYGMGEPPPEVIRGRELKTRLDAIPDGTSYLDRLQIALQLVGDTTPVGSLAEPRAKELYYRFPEVQLGMYNRWQSMLEKVEDARIDARG